MIIIKTANGDRFINEAETLQVSHVKDKAQVEVWPSRWGNQQQLPQYFIIENVEAVIYTNASQATQWIDEGSEIAKLKESLNNRTEWSKKLRDDYLKIEQERDLLKERLSKLEPVAKERWWPDNVDIAPASVIIGYIEKSRRSYGYGVRLTKVFENYDIKTVGDILRQGRHNFMRYEGVGGGSAARIDDALEELYDIKSW
jgi:hypothetical protein